MSAAATLFTPPLRGATAHLADELQAGRVYRREELARLSNAVDQHLNELVSTGVFKKLAQGLYYALRRLLLALDLPEFQDFMKEQAYHDRKVQRFRSRQLIAMRSKRSEFGDVREMVANGGQIKCQQSRHT